MMPTARDRSPFPPPVLPRRARTFTRGAVLVGLAFVLAAGCSRSEARAGEAGAGRESTRPAPGASKVEHEGYLVELSAKGPYKAGAEGTVDLVVEARGAYKLNDKYPIKLKLADPAPAGVTFPKPVLKKEDFKADAKKGKFAVPFVAATAGKATISGVLSFSVCTDQNCLMEKQSVDIVVDVI